MRESYRRGEEIKEYIVYTVRKDVFRRIGGLKEGRRRKEGRRIKGG